MSMTPEVSVPRRRPRVPVSSYAQLQARRRYHQRNRDVLNLMRKMLHAGVRLTTQECRDMVAKGGV